MLPPSPYINQFLSLIHILRSGTLRAQRAHVLHPAQFSGGAHQPDWQTGGMRNQGCLLYTSHNIVFKHDGINEKTGFVLGGRLEGVFGPGSLSPEDERTGYGFVLSLIHIYNADGCPLTQTTENMISRRSAILENKSITTDVYGQQSIQWTD